MMRLREILMAALAAVLAAGAAVGLLWVAERVLPSPLEEYEFINYILFVPFFAFFFCIPAAGVLQWLAWRWADSWTPRAQAIRRAAALCPKILKAVYIIGMAPALIFLFGSGEAFIASGIIMLYMTCPVGYLVMATLVVLRDAAEAVHVPLSLLPEGVANISCWVALFAAGWWQWFIEVPTLWRRWQAGRY